MERVVKKLSLSESDTEEASRLATLTVEERLDLFEELLSRGRIFYPEDETAKGYPRVYRIVALRES